jgi:hypothetical protein
MLKCESLHGRAEAIMRQTIEEIIFQVAGAIYWNIWFRRKQEANEAAEEIRENLPKTDTSNLYTVTVDGKRVRA